MWHSAFVCHICVLCVCGLTILPGRMIITWQHLFHFISFHFIVSWFVCWWGAVEESVTTCAGPLSWSRRVCQRACLWSSVSKSTAAWCRSLMLSCRTMGPPSSSLDMFHHHHHPNTSKRLKKCFCNRWMMILQVESRRKKKRLWWVVVNVLQLVGTFQLKKFVNQRSHKEHCGRAGYGKNCAYLKINQEKNIFFC